MTLGFVTGLSIGWSRTIGYWVHPLLRFAAGDGLAAGAFAVLVVAEMMGVKAELGWYLTWAQGWAAYANMYAALIVMALMCGGLRFCRRAVPPWLPGHDRGRSGTGRSTVVDFKGSHFEREIILWGVRWYVAYRISYRQLEEMMEERGVEVDHSSLNRWVLKYVPLLDQAFRARKRRVGGSWRMDETYVRIRGQWKYLYRAVDKAGNTVDFLLTAKRDRKAALRFLYKAIGQHGVPAKITIDKSGANTAAIQSYNSERDAEIELRQVKYLNNVVEQDHRAISVKCDR